MDEKLKKTTGIWGAQNHPPTRVYLVEKILYIANLFVKEPPTMALELSFMKEIIYISFFLREIFRTALFTAKQYCQPALLLLLHFVIRNMSMKLVRSKDRLNGTQLYLKAVKNSCRSNQERSVN